MKTVVRIVILAVVLVTTTCAQDALVNVSSKGKRTVSPIEPNRIYLSACSAVQKEFGISNALRPKTTLTLGSDKDVVDFHKKVILLKRWDRDLFAQGVVMLAFLDLLTPKRRMIMTNHAVRWADATMTSEKCTNDEAASVTAAFWPDPPIKSEI